MPTAPPRRFTRDAQREGPDPRKRPPAKLAEQLDELTTALDAQLPKKQLDYNLLVATWNIREFGSITRKWESGETDDKERDVFSIKAIAEIVSRFDVVAIQEVARDISGLQMLVRTLGPSWGLILTDVTKGKKADGERLAFVYDTRRAIPSGLACELVIPPDVLSAAKGEHVLREQFVKTPYAVAFRSEGTTFILVTLHIRYGKKPEERLPELTAIADWMRDWADDTVDHYRHNLIALGDFNIDRKGDALWQAFTAKGLTSAEGLDELPRTLPGKDGEDKHYDQIAWFTEEGEAKLTLGQQAAGNFRWDAYLFTEMTRTDKAARISDHYPLWCEFLLPERG